VLGVRCGEDEGWMEGEGLCGLGRLVGKVVGMVTLAR
jgi:hypothetical protein